MHGAPPAAPAPLSSLCLDDFEVHSPHALEDTDSGHSWQLCFGPSGSGSLQDVCQPTATALTATPAPSATAALPAAAAITAPAAPAPVPLVRRSSFGACSPGSEASVHLAACFGATGAAAIAATSSATCWPCGASRAPSATCLSDSHTFLPPSSSGATVTRAPAGAHGASASGGASDGAAPCGALGPQAAARLEQQRALQEQSRLLDERQQMLQLQVEELAALQERQRQERRALEAQLTLLQQEQERRVAAQLALQQQQAQYEAGLKQRLLAFVQERGIDLRGPDGFQQLLQQVKQHEQYRGELHLLLQQQEREHQLALLQQQEEQQRQATQMQMEGQQVFSYSSLNQTVAGLSGPQLSAASLCSAQLPPAAASGAEATQQLPWLAGLAEPCLSLTSGASATSNTFCGSRLLSPAAVDMMHDARRCDAAVLAQAALAAGATAAPDTQAGAAAAAVVGANAGAGAGCGWELARGPDLVAQLAASHDDSALIFSEPHPVIVQEAPQAVCGALAPAVYEMQGCFLAVSVRPNVGFEGPADSLLGAGEVMLDCMVEGLLMDDDDLMVPQDIDDLLEI